MTEISRIIEQHEKTNHKYGDNLPYHFHLNMAYMVFNEFKNLLDNELDYHTGRKEWDRDVDDTVSLRTACELAVWGHDLIEDTRVSYNDVKSKLGQAAAEIIYAVTNEKGKNRIVCHLIIS